MQRVERGGAHDSVEDAMVSLRIVERLLDAKPGTEFPIPLPRRMAKAETSTETGTLGGLAYAKFSLWETMAMDAFVRNTGLG
jgi:hypothetical protein